MPPAEEAIDPQAAPFASAWRWPPSRAASVAAATGLILTAALALTALTVYNRNERRLLNLRFRELGLVVADTIPPIQAPLASAAELAAASGGSPQKFLAFMGPYVGPGRQFASASLWPLGTPHLAPTAVLGTTPQLASSPSKATAFLGRASPPGVMNVTGFLSSPHPSVGLAFTARGHGRAFAVYAESLLPANRRSPQERNSAFSDLKYALYLGHSRRTRDVIVSSEKQLPIRGRQASDVVPFGASAITVVVSPTGSLGGAFFQSLPWIIAGGGVLVTLAAGIITDRLARRRHDAERLAVILDRVAAENQRMYTEQRSISQSLQHALLPEIPPELNGLRVNARYVPAATDVDVGGDWYDVVRVDDRRVLLIIGDVSGHGLRAATTMALLRHASLAYVAQDCDPATVLSKLSDFVHSGPHDYFATVLCALIDVDRHALTLASAGHLAPLVLGGDGGEFAPLRADAPIGVTPDAHYQDHTVSVPPGAVVVAFTDGLVERRGEVIDVGLARLRDLATRQWLPLDDLMAGLADHLTSADHYDDAAILGIQWPN